MTKKPLPPLSVTKFVVPSPNAALTFVASTRTTLPAPVVADSNANEPLIRWPAKVSSRLSAETRRYGPAGSASDVGRRRLLGDGGAGGVDRDAERAAELDRVARDLERDGALDAAGDAGRAEHEQRGAAGELDARARGLVADEQVHAGGADPDDLRAAAAPAAAGRGDLLEAERARERLAEELEVQRGLDDDQLGGRVDLDRDVVDGRAESMPGTVSLMRPLSVAATPVAVLCSVPVMVSTSSTVAEHELAGGQADLEVALGRARLEAEARR